MALWPSPGDLFGEAVRSQEAPEEAVNYCLQKQAHVQKAASSSPKTSWETVARRGNMREVTHRLKDNILLLGSKMSNHSLRSQLQV